MLESLNLPFIRYPPQAVIGDTCLYRAFGDVLLRCVRVAG
jgi:hypothetical protein